MHYLIDRSSHLFPSLREAWYAIPLRLIVGYGFMEHGYAKLARGPDDFANILHALGMPAATLLCSFRAAGIRDGPAVPRGLGRAGIGWLGTLGARSAPAPWQELMIRAAPQQIAYQRTAQQLIGTHMTTLSSKLAALAIALTVNSLIMGAVGFLFELQSHPHLTVVSFARQFVRHQWFI
jgi:uncharacterized membrane protein YphA (DoxX/SURF4 family)